VNRRRLVIEHLSMVEPIARRVGAALPISVELDDMIQAGRIGLMQAAERFDPGWHIPFRRYAQHRIRGAIIDAFRRRNYHWELHGELSEEMQDGAESPEQRLDREKIREHIRSALMTLTPEERFAALAHADGASYRQIGERFGHSTSWAFYAVRGANEKLRRSLAIYRLRA
jgi:RNA polymerase sigma factor (sigma-70 family)